jgi:site-specific recombinase XerD
VYGHDPSGKRVQKSLKLRDWNRATDYVRRWDAEGDQPVKPVRTTLADLQQKFLQDADARHLNTETIRKYKLLFRQLEAFATDKGIQFVDEFDLPLLTDFRTSWSDKALSASKKLERLRSVFAFALSRKWITENPARELKAPKVKLSPTLPFNAQEMKKILKAVEQPKQPRLRAFILTMRFSGLRISDTTKLEVASLKGSRLSLYQAKTGEHVSVLLPDVVAANLRRVPHKHPQYFFWTGTSKLPAAISVWRRRLSDVFKTAGIADGHSHRFRDTFAVELLQSGVPLEDVSVLLGHQNIRITQKHYSPWVRTRQERLDKEIQQANNRMQFVDSSD